MSWQPRHKVSSSWGLPSFFQYMCVYARTLRCPSSACAEEAVHGGTVCSRPFKCTSNADQEKRLIMLTSGWLQMLQSCDDLASSMSQRGMSCIRLAGLGQAASAAPAQMSWAGTRPCLPGRTLLQRQLPDSASTHYQS